MSHVSNRPCCAPSAQATDAADTSRKPESAVDLGQPTQRSTQGQVFVRGGSFAMGDHFDEGEPSDGETPVHIVEVGDFHLDATCVTNAQFTSFVEATGYVTEAEELGVSAVFHLAFRGAPADVLSRVEEAPWWLAVRDAHWRQPEGAGSGIEDRQDHPVVHVTWNDANSYADWAGKRLPTEAEWEYAARGGLAGARFVWGDDLMPSGEWQCNIWQGDFPVRNTEEDGFLTTAPVRTFTPNPFGLYQMAGNVWEWCADWFDPTFYAASPLDVPQGTRYGLDARDARGVVPVSRLLLLPLQSGRAVVNTPDSASGNLGFRCANAASAT